MKRSALKELSERDELILDAIVSGYIGSPEPVGSKTISRKHNLNISPATIRNIAAELEDKGYLTQPHTSSGRIPTDKGFRFYVDKLLRPRQLTAAQKQSIERKYDIEKLSFKEILEETSKVLSTISHNVGLVLSPKLSTSVFEHIEFVKVSAESILVVFVTKTGEVFNKRVRVAERFTQRDLHRASNYLSDVMHGLNLFQVRKKIADEMLSEKVNCDRLFSSALRVCRDATESEGGDSGIFLEGASNIISDPAFKDLKEIKRVLKAFEDKRLLMKILDTCIAEEGITTFIGEENLSKDLLNVSIVSSNYLRDGDVLGTLGVIGPRRMDYGRVIPLVDYMSKLISRLINIIN